MCKPKKKNYKIKRCEKLKEMTYIRYLKIQFMLNLLKIKKRIYTSLTFFQLFWYLSTCVPYFYKYF